MSEQVVRCSHDGNPDFYGLGIRVGIYLQLTTAIVAKYFHPEAIPENLTANTIFLLALFAAVATATLDSGLRPEEIVILLQLCFGFLLSVLSLLGGSLRPNDHDEHTTISRPPPFASYLRLILTVAICAYAVWFWFPGKDEMRMSGCATYMFLLTKVSIFGAARVFYQVQSAIFIIPLSGLFIWYSFVLLSYHASAFVATCAVEVASRRTQKEKCQQINTDVRMLVKTASRVALAMWWRDAHGLSMNGSTQCDKMSWMFRLENRSKAAAMGGMSRFASAWTFAALKLIKLLFALTCFFWTVLSVEFTLSFNQIKDVYDIRSTGQLIPFVIGLVRLLSLCHEIIVRQADTEARKILT
ncbi:MAG: hypothetical protein Q9226_009089, partial [Calogaya cf. arnoldii]